MSARKKNTIEPDEWYTLMDLVRLKVFPWCGKDIRRYRRFVQTDLEGKDHLKTIVAGAGMSRRYKFRGKDIIKFYKAVDAGSIRL